MTVVLWILTAAAIGIAVAAALAILTACLIAVCMLAEWLIEPSGRNNPITRWCRRS